MTPEALKGKHILVLKLVPFPLLTMMSTDAFQPLQLKGEVVDLEFTIDTDHRLVSLLLFTSRLINRVGPLYPRSSPKNRKRRRNRTTQSCLNCHTSKRKVRNTPPHFFPYFPHFFASVTGRDPASDVYNWDWSVLELLFPRCDLLVIMIRPVFVSMKSTILL